MNASGGRDIPGPLPRLFLGRKSENSVPPKTSASGPSTLGKANSDRGGKQTLFFVRLRATTEEALA